MNQKWYQFGNAVFRLDCAMILQEDRYVSLFQVPAMQEDYLVEIDYASLDLQPGDFSKSRVLRDQHHFKIKFQNHKRLVLSDWNAFQQLPMPQLLLEQETLILHASYLLYRGEAILFSGPSGVGKSTQADLWAKHLGAEVVNGDRTLIFRRDGRFYAGGYYQCGSSNICKNVSAPIRAIVMLEQGNVNRACSLRGVEAYRRLKEQLLSFPENRTQEQIAANFTIDLISDITVCGYECVADKSAAYHLERYLYE